MAQATLSFVICSGQREPTSVSGNWNLPLPHRLFYSVNKCAFLHVHVCTFLKFSTFSLSISFFWKKIVFYDCTIISLLFNSVYRPVLWSVLGGGIIFVPRAVPGPSFILAHLQKFIFFSSVRKCSRAVPCTFSELSPISEYYICSCWSSLSFYVNSLVSGSKPSTARVSVYYLSR